MTYTEKAGAIYKVGYYIVLILGVILIELMLHLRIWSEIKIKKSICIRESA